METQIGFAQKSDAARDLITKANGATVSTRQEHEAVGELVDAIRKFEKELADEYENLPVVIEARRIQKLKGALSRDLEDARKAAKARMLAYEDALEAERLKAEREAQEEAKRLAEQAALEAAVEAEASGDKAQAEAILAEPVVAATVVVPQEQLKAKGHTRRRVYRIKITDPSKIPADYLTPDVSKIEATARAWKKEGEIIPGVQCYSEVM